MPSLYVFASSSFFENLLFRRLKNPIVSIPSSTYDDFTNSSASSNFTETNLETPDSCIVTPYNASACSIVPLRWLMTTNWLSLLKDFKYDANRSTFASSNAASTSSKMTKGTGRERKMANNNAMAVSARSPPDNNSNVFTFLPGGRATMSIPVSK